MSWLNRIWNAYSRLYERRLSTILVWALFLVLAVYFVVGFWNECTITDPEFFYGR